MVQSGPDHVPFACQHGIDDDEIRHWRHQSDIIVTDPPTTADPSKSRVEDQQCDHPGPEDRHRVAHQAENADHVIGPPILVDRRQHAQWDAQSRADQDRQRSQFQRRRHDHENILDHRLPGADRGSEIAGQHITQIHQELDRQGPVEPQLRVYLHVSVLRRFLTHDGADGIGRHHPSDRECQNQKAQQCHGNGT